MPKVILEFDLHEDKTAYTEALNANKYLTVLDEIDNYLRAKIKYGNLPEEATEIYQEVRSKLWELRNDE